MVDTPAPAIDPAVRIPDHVAAQARAAEAAHKAAYAPSPPPEQSAASPAAPAPAPAAPPEQRTAEPPAPAPAAPADTAPDKTATLTPEQWRHAYLSMKGRYDQAATSIGGLQEQLQEVSDELMRTQRAVRPPQQRRPAQQRPAALITEKDMENFGPDVIDLVTRAARAAVAPDLQNLHQGVQQVGERIQQVRSSNVYDVLDLKVPDWRAINLDPRFKSWCSLRDVYSGQLRSTLLNDALKAADAPRAVAFFQGFLAEEQATGALPDPLGQPAPLVPARTPALTLDSLTAPGRAKPAGGETPQPVDKPIFTRAQIRAFYDAVRQGQFNGREADKNATEQAIFVAQREGRVR